MLTSFVKASLNQMFGAMKSVRSTPRAFGRKAWCSALRCAARRSYAQAKIHSDKAFRGTVDEVEANTGVAC